jgi:hypothetical protein
MPDQQWQVDSVTPTPPNPTPPQDAGQWQVDSVTPTPPTATPSPRDPGWSLHNVALSLGEAKQNIKDSINRELIGGIGLTTGKMVSAIPGINKVWTSLPNDVAAAQRAHDTPYSTDPEKRKEQEAYDHLENIVEYMTGDKAFEGATQLMKIDALAPVAAALKKAPVATKILGNAVKNAVLSGGQSALHGGSITDIAKSAFAGAGLSAAMEATPAAINKGMDAIAEAKPTTTPIAGANFPTLAKGGLNIPALNEVGIDPGTAAADQAHGNLAKRAVARTLTRSNAARAALNDAAPIVTDPTRMLPPPEGRAQGFQVQPPEATETITQPTVQPSEPQYNGQQTVPNPNYQAPGGSLTQEPGQTPEQAAQQIGTSAETIPPRVITGPGPVDTRNAAQTRLDLAGPTVPERVVTGEPTTTESIWQQPNPQATGGGVDRSMGGPMILTNDGQGTSVMKARANLQNYERIMNGPEWDEIGVRNQQQILDAHADLSDQLHRYDDYAANRSHFPMHDVNEAIRNTNGLIDGGQLLMDEHRPFWQTANRESGGAFTALDNQRKGLEASLYNDSSTTSRLSKIEDLQHVHNQMDALFDKYRTSFAPGEWKIAKDGYADGANMKQLGHLYEAHINGITQADQALRPPSPGGRGLQRVFDPGASYNNSIEKMFNDPQASKSLDRTIGTEGKLDMKEIGQLFQNSQRRGATQNIIQYIGKAIRNHAWAYGGIAGGLASGAAHLPAELSAAIGFGTPLAKGTITGTIKYITDKLATDPDFLKSFTYAVKNDVAPTVAGQLLAHKLIMGRTSSEMVTSQNQGANTNTGN